MPASGGLFDLDALDEQITEDEHRMAEPGFWDDNVKAQKLINETNELKDKRDTYVQLKQQIDDLQTNVELLEMEADPDLEEEFETSFVHTEKALEQYRLNQLLDGEYDSHNAILEIHPGAGGPKLRTGAPCSCGCTFAGANSTALRWKQQAMRLVKPRE